MIIYAYYYEHILHAITLCLPYCAYCHNHMLITPFACYHMMLTILCLLPQQYAYYTICIRPHCAYHLTPIAITTCLLRHIMMIMKIKETRMVRQIGEIRNIKNIIHNKNNNYAHSSAYDYAILGHAIAITI